ncbi:alpha-1,2-mannosyltransferase ALG9 isoform X8 [Manis javanica]|uniref:alpha-1,2-mannosyltransferase ALG9 isoform X8 n=1 Tax=Manis javanica TaxID=9974 RepID=UPI003C6CE839
MASRGARQRSKGGAGSGGDAASAADRLRELLCSREAGSSEPRPESSGTKAGQVWAPEGSTAFKCLLSARLCAALLSNISDCDETFNYWEPTHYLIYGKGFQTWEYSPVYAIRSYAYLLLHAWPAAFHARILQTNKILVFYFVRCLLAFVSCICELYFYKAVCKKFGLHVSRMMLAFLVLSTGMFCSSSAFLPSSFCMYTTLIAMAGWYMDKTSIAVLGAAAGAIIGWPFSAALGLPIAFDFLVMKRRWKSLFHWSLVALILFLVPVVVIDSYYYGKLVVTPLNIVLYNVFTPHGPDLYGKRVAFGLVHLGHRVISTTWTQSSVRPAPSAASSPLVISYLPVSSGTEPWHFYLINGFLNFNVAFALALLALPLTSLMERLLQRFHASQRGEISFPRVPSYMSVWRCGPFCTSEMLSLRVSAIPPGALHCDFKLAGIRDTPPVWALILFSLGGTVQRWMYHEYPNLLSGGTSLGVLFRVIHYSLNWEEDFSVGRTCGLMSGL